MSFKISCPMCGKVYELSDEKAGKTAKCGCGERIILPPIIDETVVTPPKNSNLFFSATFKNSLVAILLVISMIGLLDLTLTKGKGGLVNDLLWFATYLAVFLAGIAIYFIPSAVAYSRNHLNFRAVFILNIALGWTFLGWVAALVWASMATQHRPVTIGNDSPKNTP